MLELAGQIKSEPVSQIQSGPVSQIQSELVNIMELPMPTTRLELNYGCNNGRSLYAATMRSLFMLIVTPRGTVDVAVEVDIGCALLVRVPCNRAVKRVPKGVFHTDKYASEDVQFNWSRR